MTLEPSTLSAADFLASHIPLPGSKEARKMTVISGRKCAELLPRLGHGGSLQRMSLALMAQNIWHSTECFLTWRPSITQRRRLKFRLVPSTPPTDEQDSGLWPTMTVSSGAQTKENPTPGQTGGTTLWGAARMWPTMTSNDTGQRTTKYAQGGTPLSAAALWSTPQAHDLKKGYPERYENPERSNDLADEVLMMWATPTTRDHKDGSNVENVPENALLGGQVKPSKGVGSLNPEFVCWLMGFPEGWTNLKPSETQLSPKSPKSSGAPS
jgi:hypothetical protein